MTEPSTDAETPDASAQWNPKTDPDGYSLDDVVAKDTYLNLLITAAAGSDDTNADSAIGITIQAGGHTVSGLVISREQWINLLVASLKPADAEMADAIGGAYRQVQTSNLAERARREEAGLPKPVRGFIHMKDVRINPGSEAGINVPLWRGKLADVTGWSLGSWNAVDDEA